MTLTPIGGGSGGGGGLAIGTVQAGYGRPAYNLTAAGLNGSTTNIKTLLDAAVSAGAKHIIVPYSATPWPMTSKWTATGVTLEFERGARIAFNISGSSGMDLTNCTLINASFTSTTYSVPSSAAAITDAAYAYPSRNVILRDNCRVEGTYYHEYAVTGLYCYGKHITLDATLSFKNMRHRSGWASCIHVDGAGASGGTYDVRCTGLVYAEDCDRAIEIEDGAHDVDFSAGGVLKNIYPNGYTGQPADTSNPDASVYANYTAVLDAHSHDGTGGCYNIHYGGTWLLDNCGGGVTFTRANGSNASDLPKNCRAEEVVIKGRGLGAGSPAIQIQGDSVVDKVRLQLGSGISGSSFHRLELGTGTPKVGEVYAEAFTLPLVNVLSTADGATIGTVTAEDGKQSGSGYLVDVAAPNTRIAKVKAKPVAGTSGYVRFQATATNARLTTGEFSLSGAETIEFITDLTTTAKLEAAGYPRIKKSYLTAGRFFALSGGSTGTGAPTAGELRMIPVYIPQDITIDAIGMEVTTASAAASGGLVRPALYYDNGGIPGDPVVASSSISSETTGIKYHTFTAMTLLAGWYWQGGVTQVVTSTVRYALIGVSHFPLLTGTDTNAMTGQNTGEIKSGVTGALPTWGTGVGVTSAAPKIIVRLA